MKKLSDKQYIEKIIKDEASRKRTLIFIVSLAILMLIPIIYYTSTIYGELQLLLSNLHSNSELKIDSALKASDEKGSFYIGFGTGCAITAGYFAAISMLGHALGYYLSGRKDRMLIKYYEQSNK